MKMITVPAESLRLIVRALDGYATANQMKHMPHALDNMRITFTEEELSWRGVIDEKQERPAILEWREEPEWFNE